MLDSIFLTFETDQFLLLAMGDNNIINKEQIGFMKERRTTDHMFVLKTLLDKYVERNSKPLYACFVDFKCL
jgi:hypothetical protein